MEAAEGIIRIVNESMFGALRLVSVEQGYDPRDFALVGFGGAGPLHANALGILTEAWPVIVPPGPGRAVRLRRCHHAGAGRGGAHLPDHGRRSATSSCWRICTSCASAPASPWLADGIPAEDARGHLPGRSALCGPGVPDHRRFHRGGAPRARHRAAHGAVRRGARAAVHLQARRRTRNPDDPRRGPGGSARGGRAQLGQADAELADCLVHDSRFYAGSWHEAPIYERERLLLMAWRFPDPASCRRWTRRPWCCPATRHASTASATC
jgi:N-methylhydantoinase A